MKVKIPLLLLAAPVVFGSLGCGSSDNAPMTPEAKKSFVGSPMPADFKAKMQSGQAAGQEVAAKAAAEAAKQHSK